MAVLSYLEQGVFKAFTSISYKDEYPWVTY